MRKILQKIFARKLSLDTEQITAQKRDSQRYITMEDKTIVQLFWKRSEQAIEALDQKYGIFLFRIAMNLLSNKQDSEECVNDTYLQTWNSIPEARPDSLKLYTGRIARNLALNRIKHNTAQKRGQHVTDMLSELSECIPSPSAIPGIEYEQELLRKTIAAYVAELDDLNRCIFVRRYWMGESVGAIARLAGISENAVSTRLYRMRADLKQALEIAGYYV